jgi:1,4-dihydroxy-2-naphthoate polyprenyltransferase
MQDTHTQPSQTTFPSWKIWLKTSRPFSLTATVSPILVGTALAAYHGTFHIVEFVLTLFSCLFLQIGTN